jgi:hypothetical protein
MADAVVHIGAMPKAEIVREFYQKCGLETLDAARIQVGELLSFSTLEGLVDKMISRTEAIQIVVNHGSSDKGLHIPFVPGAKFNATGPMMSDLATLATDAGILAKGRARLTEDNQKVKNAAQMMGTNAASVIRLAEKLVKLREKKTIIEIRGCNVGANPGFLRDYKKAFGAARVTAPGCRMFYLRIKPHKPGKGVTMGDLSGDKPKTGNTRRRFISYIMIDPADIALNNASPIIIDVRDIDGHSQVDSESFMNDPKLAAVWAAKLNGAWKQAPTGFGNDQFVLPVMWDDNEPSYHCPHDGSYRKKLVSV